MTALVIPFKHAKARILAERKGAQIRELAEEFARFLPETREMMAQYYEGQGWASRTDLRLAIDTLEETNG